MKKFLLSIWVLFCIMFLNTAVKAQYKIFNHNGINRKYIIHLPPLLPPNSPLVFMLHSYGGTAFNMIDYTGMSEIADANQFAVCYPEGTKDEWGVNCWNLHYDFQMGMNIDDVDFLDCLAVYLQNKHHLDPEKTYCSGHSNGGDMCYMIACQDSGIFKAVAAVAGCLMKWIHDSCYNASPIPVFEIHGTEDETTLWNGDLGNVQGYGPYYGVPFTFDFWTTVNNCQNELIDTLPDLDPTDGSIVISQKRVDGINGYQVWLYEMLGAGHSWPGTGGSGTNMDINTSAEIWSFFQNCTSLTSVDKATNLGHTISLAPNPTKVSVKVILDPFYNILSYKLHDLTGRTILQGFLNHKETLLDVGHLSKGAYLLKTNDSSVKVLKIIVE